MKTEQTQKKRYPLPKFDPEKMLAMSIGSTQPDAAGAVQPELEIYDAERKQMGGHGDIEPFIGFSATVRIKGRAGIAHFQSSDYFGTEYGVSKEETEAIMRGMVTAYNERPALLARIGELEAMLHGKRDHAETMAQAVCETLTGGEQ